MLTQHSPLCSTPLPSHWSLAGSEAAEYLSQHLLSYVLESPDLPDDPCAALERAVERAEMEILTQLASCSAGSTLLAVLLLDDMLYVAHVGDCRAVLAKGGEATALTSDHKPLCRYERARIEAVHPGAMVTPDGYMYGELAVARGLGSAHLKRDPSKKAFTHVPDVSSIQLVREDDFLILASDGLVSGPGRG